MHANSKPRLEALAMQELQQKIEIFLRNIDYKPPPKPRPEPLREAIIQRADVLGISIDADKAGKAWVDTAITVAAEMYPDHPLSCQIYIATLTWLAFIIDDRNKDLSVDLDLFQQRLFAGAPQSNPVLTGFAEVLAETHDHYDPLIANFINQSALAYVNANAMESRKEYQEMQPPRCAINWPYYFREKEGIPEAYTYFIFPKAQYPDITAFLPAVPDMMKFIALTNDILSFYKEEKAGETANYVHKVLFCYPGLTALEVLGGITITVSEAYQRILQILDCVEEEKYRRVWVAYCMGYCAMHLRNHRYQLVDVVPHLAQE
ncbi:hypothetical protein BST61_g8448 [Cercospora zeina]